MKKYIHETHNEVQTALVKVTKRQPDLFDDIIVDETGKEVDTSNLSRKDELTSSVGAEYLMSFIDYICTHHRSEVDTSGASYYEIANVDFQAALDIMSGGIKSQRKRAAVAIYHYCTSPKPCLIIPPDGGQMHHMIPIVVDLTLVDGNKLTPKQAGKIARLRYTKIVDKETGEKQVFDVTGVVDTMTILFAKPLCSAFFAKKNSTYSFPTGLYANAWQIAHDIKTNNEGKTGYEAIEKMLKIMDTEINLAAFMRLVRYITIHNNLTKDDIKNKDIERLNYLDEIDLLQHVYPSFLHREKNGKLGVDRDKFSTFLIAAFMLWSKIPGFLFYATLSVDADPKQGKLAIAIFTSQENMEKYLLENGDQDAMDRANAIRQYKLANPQLRNTTIAQHFNCDRRTVYNALHPKSKTESTDKTDPPKENPPK